MAVKSAEPFEYASANTTRIPFFRASSAVPCANDFGKIVSSLITAIVFSPRFETKSIKPSRYTSAGGWGRNANLRPFLKGDVGEAAGATKGILYFWLTSATVSVIAEL